VLVTSAAQVIHAGSLPDISRMIQCSNSSGNQSTIPATARRNQIPD